MIKFFTEYEAIINLVSFSLFIGIILLPIDKLQTKIANVFHFIFIVAFSVCCLSVLINGCEKGF